MDDDEGEVDQCRSLADMVSQLHPRSLLRLAPTHVHIPDGPDELPPSLSQLPRLTAFQLEAPETPAADWLDPLAHLPFLIDVTLDLWACETADKEPLLASLSRCRALQRLDLRNAEFPSPGSFRSLCCSPALASLTSLRLSRFQALPDERRTAPTADDYHASFSALEQLESLELHRIFDVDALLAHVHHAPALRRLSLACFTHVYSPSHAVLLGLHSRAPLLRTRLLLPATLSKWMHEATAQILLIWGQLLGPQGGPRALDQQWRMLTQECARIPGVTVRLQDGTGEQLQDGSL